MHEKARSEKFSRCPHTEDACPSQSCKTEGKLPCCDACTKRAEGTPYTVVPSFHRFRLQPAWFVSGNPALSGAYSYEIHLSLSGHLARGQVFH
jgi:hypothetical protein